MVVAPSDAACSRVPRSRCHWYLKVLPTPSHVPWRAVSAEPRDGVPVGAGIDVSTGGAPTTVSVGSEATVTVPS